MDEKFKELLKTVMPQTGRSRLEPYGELIDELRLLGLPYREIASLLTEKYELHVTKSTIHDFVRVRLRRQKKVAKRATKEAAQATAPAPARGFIWLAQSSSGTRDAQPRSVNEKSKSAPIDDFHYDPTKPLTLLPQGNAGSGNTE